MSPQSPRAQTEINVREAKFEMRSIGMWRIAALVCCLGVTEPAIGQNDGAKVSHGIRGAVVAAALVPSVSHVTITIQLTNTTNNLAHLMSVGSLGASSPGIKLLRVPGDAGLTMCAEEPFDDVNAAKCRSKFGDDLTRYHDIGPNESVRAMIEFYPVNGVLPKPGSILSYSFLGFVRYSDDSDNTLKADQPPGPIHTVTLNFPPLPVQ